MAGYSKDLLNYFRSYGPGLEQEYNNQLSTLQKGKGQLSPEDLYSMQIQAAQQAQSLKEAELNRTAQKQQRQPDRP